MQIYNINNGNAINVLIFEDCQRGSAFFNRKMLERSGEMNGRRRDTEEMVLAQIRGFKRQIHPWAKV
jgi:hypothetical protein